MKKMIFAWLFLTVMLVGTLTFIGLSMKNSYKEYYTLEKNIDEAASIYLIKEKIELRRNFIITDKDLKDTKLYTNFSVNEDSCSAFILVKNKKETYDTKAYIKCSNYTTENYDEIFNKYDELSEINS